ncbi:unnamed protein product [Ambrosiozyma monospora]|uniref:Unnamed protein product n=1 Tax=Ambrosiozyma monospora TaxID=43982 RepID=A0ACB5TSI3_AMBMO|nr:unnamed protein product [Ambrosiozyma monospora]
MNTLMSQSQHSHFNDNINLNLSNNQLSSSSYQSQAQALPQSHSQSTMDDDSYEVCAKCKVKRRVYITDENPLTLQKYKTCDTCRKKNQQYKKNQKQKMLRKLKSMGVQRNDITFVPNSNSNPDANVNSNANLSSSSSSSFVPSMNNTNSATNTNSYQTTDQYQYASQTQGQSQVQQSSRSTLDIYFDNVLSLPSQQSFTQYPTSSQQQQVQKRQQQQIQQLQYSQSHHQHHHQDGTSSSPSSLQFALQQPQEQPNLSTLDPLENGNSFESLLESLSHNFETDIFSLKYSMVIADYIIPRFTPSSNPLTSNNSNSASGASSTELLSIASERTRVQRYRECVKTKLKVHYLNRILDILTTFGRW